MTSDVKKISDKLRLYQTSGDHKNLRELKEYLKEHFFSDEIVFWKFQSDTNTLEMFSSENIKRVTLDNSLIKNCIDTKSPMILDHVTSNKSYCPSIDNPLKLKIKSMLLFPFVRNNKVLGIATLYRDTKRQNIFMEKDEVAFRKFSFAISKLFEKATVNQKNKSNTKNHTHEILPVEKKKLPKKSNKKIKSIEELELEIEALKNLSSGLQEENKVLNKELTLFKTKDKKDDLNQKKSEKVYQDNIAKLETLLKDKDAILKEYEKKDKENSHLIKKYKEEIAHLISIDNEFQAAHKRMIVKYEKSELKLLSTIDKYKNTIEELKEKNSNKFAKDTNKSTDVNTLKKLNDKIDYLEGELKKYKKDNEVLSLELKEKKSNLEAQNKKENHVIGFQEKLINENHNFEFILQKAYRNFVDSKHAYMLFELMIFALNAEENIKIIDTNIEKSNILLPIVEEFEFENKLKIHNQKHLVSDFFDNIKYFQNSVLQSKIKLDITLDKFMPRYFIFDTPKVQSIILHLLMDLQEFIDESEPINMHFIYSIDTLHIEIEGKLFQDSGGILSPFSKKRVVKDISKRPSLLTSIELLNLFGCDIEPKYGKSYYRFSFDVPIEAV